MSVTTEVMSAVLKMHPFASGMEPEQLAMLSTLAREGHFEKGQIIFREGEECRFFYLVMGGRIALEIPAPGHPALIQTLGPGDELGWSSMLMRGGRHFQSRAVERTEVIWFDAGELHTLCHREPEFGLTVMERLLGIVSERLEATRMQLMDLYAPHSR